MCLLFIAHKSHPLYKLIVAANRDEYYERPTEKAAFWDESPGVLAGRDLRAGGTWLGITRKGKIAAITNYRDPKSINTSAPSRGRLVSDFLSKGKSPLEYLHSISTNANQYNGFNLIVGEKDEIYWYSNRGEGAEMLSPGMYGLSNHLLNTPWPKVNKIKSAFQRLLSKGAEIDTEMIFEILFDKSTPNDNSLPDTGVGLEWERILSPVLSTTVSPLSSASAVPLIM
jgi:uncharacterized protein with NRDE domain